MWGKSVGLFQLAALGHLSRGTLKQKRIDGGCIDHVRIDLVRATYSAGEYFGKVLNEKGIMAISKVTAPYTHPADAHS